MFAYDALARVKVSILLLRLHARRDTFASLFCSIAESTQVDQGTFLPYTCVHIPDICLSQSGTCSTRCIANVAKKVGVGELQVECISFPLSLWARP